MSELIVAIKCVYEPFPRLRLIFNIPLRNEKLSEGRQNNKNMGQKIYNYRSFSLFFLWLICSLYLLLLISLFGSFETSVGRGVTDSW